MSLGKNKLLHFNTFVRVPFEFQRLVGDGLSLNGMRVILYLFSNSEDFHPSIEAICTHTGILPSAVARTLKDLIDGGFIKRVRLGNDRMRKTTIYDLNPTIEKMKVLKGAPVLTRVQKAHEVMMSAEDRLLTLKAFSNDKKK